MAHRVAKSRTRLKRLSTHAPLHKFKVNHNYLIYVDTAKWYYALLLKDLSLNVMESIFEDSELEKKMPLFVP